jgi:hypothetical protein
MKAQIANRANARIGLTDLLSRVQACLDEAIELDALPHDQTIGNTSAVWRLA